MAVLIYFANDWLSLIRAAISSIVERRVNPDPDRRLAWAAGHRLYFRVGFAGVLLESKISDWFHTPNPSIRPEAMIIMAAIIALLGGALLLAERLAVHVRHLDQLSLTDAIVIGLAQAIAVFPGVSRSGSTITAGLALGLERESAARFSFLLSAPIIAGAGAKSLVEIYSGLSSGAIAQSDLALFPIGVIAAAISGYLAIRFLMRYVQNHPTNIFVYYRWVLAIVIVVVALTRH